MHRKNLVLKSVLILVLLSNLNFAYSQVDKFIEISVEDTIIIKPTKIHYNISILPNYNPSGLPSNSAKSNETKNELEEILTKNKFQFQALNHQGEYSILNQENSPINNKITSVTLKNEGELGKLIDKIKDIQNISGNVGFLEFEENSDIESELIRRVIQKGQKKATIIVAFFCPFCITCLLYTSPSPRDATLSRMPSSA